MHTTELEDPGDDDPSIAMIEDGPPPMEDDGSSEDGSEHRRPEMDAEYDIWARFTDPDRQAALRDVMAKRRSVAPEVLVRLCCLAHKHGDRRTLNLAFEALSKSQTPLLLSQAWGLSAADRQDQVKEILLSVFEAIQKGTASYAAKRFASFTKRRSISLYRTSVARFEGANERVEPSDDSDPVDLVPARIPSAEARALLGVAITKLSEDQRAVFIQWHLMEMTQKEIADQLKVSVRTVYSLLKEAEVATGLTGDTHDN